MNEMYDISDGMVVINGNPVEFGRFCQDHFGGDSQQALQFLACHLCTGVAKVKAMLQKAKVENWPPPSGSDVPKIWETNTAEIGM